MANIDVIAFNIGTFVSALFLLEIGADKFVDHTAVVARRIGVSQALVGLLTAGAEWEELAVVVASLARNRSSLAVGNVVGSAISNILGAFSLGLLAHPTGIEFDSSSKIYSSLLLGITTFVAPLLYFPRKLLWTISGSVLLAVFVVYVVSVCWAINSGRVTKPEGSDSDSSSEEDSDDGSSHGADVDGLDETSPLIRETQPPLSQEQTAVRRKHKRPRSLRYHCGILAFGFLTLCLASYLLSHSAATLADEVGLSDVLFGVIILALATTLPEKLVAVLSGFKGHSGILVANTVGSNIFLLSLCLGVVMVVVQGDFDAGSVNLTELCVLWASTVAFMATVWFGARYSRWIGWAMLVCYVAFIVAEFAVVH